jgi:hydroxypyruvate reductase 1
VYFCLVQATLAAANVAAVLQGYAVWPKPDNVLPFVEKPLSSLPKAAPSIVNHKELGLSLAAAE